MSIPQVKGVCIKAALGYLRENGLLEETLSELPEHYQSHFRAEILPAIWYPLEPWVELLEAVRKPYSREMPDIHARIGGRIVEEGVNSTLRGFFRAGAIQWFIKRSPILWSVIFKGTDLVIERKGNTAGCARVVGDTINSRALCRAIGGGISEALLMIGADDVEVTHVRCRCDGWDDCVFEATWAY